MSDDDALLAALAQHAREAPPDPRLEALLDGTLSATDRADLLADGADDPALAAGIAIYTPLDAAAMDAMTDHLLAHVIGAEATDGDERDEIGEAEDEAAIIDAAHLFSAQRPPDAAVVDEDAPSTAPKPAVEPPTPLPNRRWWLAAPLLAAAAAVAFFVMRPTATVLPAYSVEITGGDVPKRGDDKGPLPERVLRDASQLRIVLVPPAAHTHAVRVRAFVHDGQTFHPWAPTVRVENAAALISGTVADLGLTTHGKGKRTLVFQLFADGESPGAPSLDADRTDARQLLVPVILE